MNRTVCSLLVSLLTASLATACGGEEAEDAACGAPATDLSTDAGFVVRLAGGESGEWSVDSEVGWFDFNGDVSISMGNEFAADEPTLYLYGLTAEEGVQCAGGARMILDGTTYLNGSNAAEGFDVGGTPFSVEILSYEDDVYVEGITTGSFTETEAGAADEPVDVEAAFAVDLQLGF